MWMGVTVSWEVNCVAAAVQDCDTGVENPQSVTQLCSECVCIAYVWSGMWSGPCVECMSSGRRAAHLITSTQDVLRAFTPRISIQAGYRPSLAYL